MLLNFISLIVLLGEIYAGECVDLNFENPESGFFLRPDGSSQELNIASEISPNVWSSSTDDGGVMDVERFKVLDPTKPALIRATYGPFSTKQTVPARFVLPEFSDEQDFSNNSYIPTIHSHHLEVSAHIVIKEVTRTRPTLRVLIHGAGAKGHHSPHLCVSVFARKGKNFLSGSCTPTGAGETGGDATCLVSIRVPSFWWPQHTRSTVKLPRTNVAVSYLVGTSTSPLECRNRDNQSANAVPKGPIVTVQPETSIGEVSLTLDQGGYDEISIDPLVHAILPRSPLYPGSIIQVPLYLNPRGNLPALVFMIRCKVRNGISLLAVESSNSAWNVSTEINSRRTAGSVTAMLTNPVPNNETLHTLGLHEVFCWVFEVPADAMAGDIKIIWSLQYTMDTHLHETFSRGKSRRMSAKLSTSKDVIQAVLPISKSWSLVNTAVLTGRQVSRAIKVLIVSQAGKVADVTLQSSCSCTDEAALKVSTSCTSVFLDGSEVRGSHNATIVARYGMRSGSASFTVWMPEFPLMVSVKDQMLSQIKDWTIPKNRFTSVYASKTESLSNNRVEQTGSSACVGKFQQTPVEVFGRFVAVDDNSGRESYLLSRLAKVRVTELVIHLLRVADTTVATINQTIVSGKFPGRTEVQVLSPITGRVIGDKEIRVESDKIWIQKLHANVISGLALSLQPDMRIPDGYFAITKVTPTLTAKYQEGLVDIWVEFSDGQMTPLHEIAQQHYSLSIRSLDPNIIAVAPSLRTSSAQPRIIATGHGEGNLLKVTLSRQNECDSRRTLTSTLVQIKVDLNSQFNQELKSERQSTIEQNEIKENRLSELPIADAAVHDHYILPHISRKPEFLAHMNPSSPSRLSSLEVGMYILLAVFGVTLVAFTGSCIVIYTWRIKGRRTSLSSPYDRKRTVVQDPVANAHDWVWLGRATLERASGIIPSPDGGGKDSENLNLGNNNNNDDQRLELWNNHQYFSKAYGNGKTSDAKNEHVQEVELEPLIKTNHPLRENLKMAVGSSTFTKCFRSPRKVSFNASNKNEKNTSQDELAPPIPPHGRIDLNRYGKNSQFANKATPQDMKLIVNPLESHTSAFLEEKVRYLTHIQHQNANQQNEKLCRIPGEQGPNVQPKFVEVNADDFVRLRGITRNKAAQVRKANILENPLLSTTFPDNLNIAEHFENLPPTMDYEQLMKYFSNLRESNA